ncbi:hypothetical protein SAMN04487967_0447 [Natronorubrum sediminis]|uniref:Uncharacterized protein n=1 Tax=Natronorubrum sediminis TaxID=640943 RepID=A0A1H6FPG2_9EURY|nr:hypothetical protein [Natronorubrum sediminis]SEH11644.1 hypothetical protein SAMN04487967_0447 [Natronorubrum sediminis]
MPQEVTVHVNRGSTDSLEAAVSALETRGSFNLLLDGHERPAHVHCRLHGDLERIATLETSNYYVETEGETVVPVHVAAENLESAIEGQLEVVTGYGSETVTVPVVVKPAPGPVDVDESLAEPANPTPEPSPLERVVTTSGLDPATLAVVALGLVAIGIATVTAATVGGTLSMIGVGIVAVGFCVALVLLVR